MPFRRITPPTPPTPAPTSAAAAPPPAIVPPPRARIRPVGSTAAPAAAAPPPPPPPAPPSSTAADPLPKLPRRREPGIAEGRLPDGRFLDELPYEVGKYKPPVKTRWQKGQSGNPAGGRKKKPEQTAAELAFTVLSEPMPVATPGGGVTGMSAPELGWRKLRERMVKGDLRATLYILNAWEALRPGAAPGADPLGEEPLSAAELQLLQSYLQQLGPGSDQLSSRHQPGAQA